jgi:hypothetical protein
VSPTSTEAMFFFRYAFSMPLIIFSLFIFMINAIAVICPNP